MGRRVILRQFKFHSSDTGAENEILPLIIVKAGICSDHFRQEHTRCDYAEQFTIVARICTQLEDNPRPNVSENAHSSIRKPIPSLVWHQQLVFGWIRHRHSKERVGDISDPSAQSDSAEAGSRINRCIDSNVHQVLRIAGLPGSTSVHHSRPSKARVRDDLLPDATGPPYPTTCRSA